MEVKCDGGEVTFVGRALVGCRRGSCLQRNRGIQQCEYVRDYDGCQSPSSSVCEWCVSVWVCKCAGVCVCECECM